MAEPEGAEPAPLPESVEDALASLHEKGKLPTETVIDRWCSAHPDAAQRIRGAIAALRELTPPERPEHVGPWRIRSTLGEGGMGTVYLAERTEPVHMRAALKLIKLGMDSRAVLARFEQERQALARMQHDGIAKVYDCGTSERGQPYFAMELVEGRPLTTFCDANQVGLAQRLRLMRSVCDAVQHAHNKGVVHRDLKPSNVLVSGDAEAPRIKVIDFGLAKALGEKLVAATLFTEAGQLIGTPEYMAPEQADPLNTDIDTRADVYSLGVMLYELLVGELPFSTK
ncbi:MAG: Serine/threonine-protein kinase PknB, partial [Planctomycetota bacterium]